MCHWLSNDSRVLRRTKEKRDIEKTLIIQCVQNLEDDSSFLVFVIAHLWSFRFSLTRTWDKKIQSTKFQSLSLSYLHLICACVIEEFINQSFHCTPIDGCLFFISLIIGICWHCVCLLVDCRTTEQVSQKKKEEQDDEIHVQTIRLLIGSTMEIVWHRNGTKKVCRSISDWPTMLTLTLLFWTIIYLLFLLD